MTINDLEGLRLPTGCLKKHNLFDLEYLRDALMKLIVLLVCHSLVLGTSFETSSTGVLKVKH